MDASFWTGVFGAVLGSGIGSGICVFFLEKSYSDSKEKKIETRHRKKQALLLSNELKLLSDQCQRAYHDYQKSKGMREYDGEFPDAPVVPELNLLSLINRFPEIDTDFLVDLANLDLSKRDFEYQQSWDLEVDAIHFGEFGRNTAAQLLLYSDVLLGFAEKIRSKSLLPLFETRPAKAPQ